MMTNTEKQVSPEFQKRLSELIDDKDYNRKEFAESVGISKESVSRMTVYGIIPSVKALIKIADFFEVSIPYLLGESSIRCFYRSENPKTFYIRLEELAKEHDVKYCKIARKMPFPYSYFYDWFHRNTLPTLEYLKAIAEYFDVSVDYLLGRTDDRD